MSTCPKCGSTKIENDECLHCGIVISKYLAYLERQHSTPTGSATASGGAPVPQMQTVDFTIQGQDMQFVEIELRPGATAIAEAGSMMYAESGVELQTVMGDGSPQGFFGKVLSASKRVLANESLFMTAFTNQVQEARHVAFAAPIPGKILAINLSEMGGELIAQKDAFLAAALGVTIGIAFQKRLGVGFFGGQGFIMERLRGNGVVFVNTGGTVHDRVLQPGEVLRAEAGSIVAFQPTVDFGIQYVGSIKSALFGGQGFFFATLRGPGRVWLQSLTLSKLINRIAAQVGAASAAGSAGGAGGGLLAGVPGGGSGGDAEESGSNGGDDSGGDSGDGGGSDSPN